ncbi:hypothetical protein [Planotetraspora mira]|uniref:Uncharacterized protein n=1 Tax=Planotetraspora mira TaxID=58121 RepID=A0A8J3TY31_9ACTN|nr:hypothetical protein [Planotetraspora mira]GII34631.1 hypothetical protein Pmi06nite_80730 [Planotetraspora mira]
MTTPNLCVLRWDRPGQMTVLALPGDRIAEGERVAIAALGEDLPDPRWNGLATAERRTVVRACRSVPTLGLYVLFDERDAADEADSLHRCLAQAVEEFLQPMLSGAPWEALPSGAARELRDAARSMPWPGSAPARWRPESSLPGLRGLVTLTALACRETLTEVNIPQDEDLLDIYDTYSVGALDPGQWPM